jgi:hypothetical protein
MKLTVEEGLRLAAGCFVLLSVALGIWVNPLWFGLTAFVGLNLLQSAFSHWCPMMWILRRAGLPEHRVAGGRLETGCESGRASAQRRA